MIASSWAPALHRLFGITKTTASDPQQRRVGVLFAAYEERVFLRTNQLFWWLLLAQWAFAIAVSLLWSPLAWEGDRSSVHPHLLAAVFLGGLLVLPPLLVMRTMPTQPLTRHLVAMAQVASSALLIHLTGGRIETHFHVFGSLAFLALYRDWRVLITATVIVALDHLLRGIWYPTSVYGVPYASAWRTLEHAAWVIFEDVVLVWACAVSRREMWEICRREDQNQQLLEALEERVQERTAALQAEVREHQRTAIDLRASEERYRTLVDNAPIGIFKTTRAGEVRFANSYLLRLIGLPPATDLAKLNMADGRGFASADRERLWSRLESQGEVRGFHTSYTKLDGAKVDLVLNARLVAKADNGESACEGTVEDVTDEKQAKRDLEKVHQQLLIASRQAGMADVATGVLHNVGNVLTSVNITVQDLTERLRTSRITLLHQVVQKLQQEQPRLAAFFTEDPAGRRLPELLAKLDVHLTEENARMREDVEGLNRHFVHIREVIVSQQSAARMFGVAERVTPELLVEDALKLNVDSLGRHGIALKREFAPTPAVNVDRHKVLQILVNLLKNAKDALLSNGVVMPEITVRVATAGADQIFISVADNGIGIAPENLKRIFSHGFTTKKDGHGFGLHSCVLAAREMKGDLTATSDGPGRGAVFTLTLPIAYP